MFHTTVPTKYRPTEALNTSSQEPDHTWKMLLMEVNVIQITILDLASTAAFDHLNILIQVWTMILVSIFLNFVLRQL